MDTLITKIKTSHGHAGYPTAISLEQLAGLIADPRQATSSPRNRDRQPQLLFAARFGRNGLHDPFRQLTGPEKTKRSFHGPNYTIKPG